MSSTEEYERTAAKLDSFVYQPLPEEPSEEQFVTTIAMRQFQIQIASTD